MFKDLGPKYVSAEQAYLSRVRSSDIYVGMWGPPYGVRMADGYFATPKSGRSVAIRAAPGRLRRLRAALLCPVVGTAWENA